MDHNRNKKPSRKENPFREWVSDNLRYIVLIAVIVGIVAAIVFGVRVISENVGGGENVSSAQNDESTENGSDEDNENGPDADGEDTVSPAPESTETPSPSPEEISLSAAPEEVSQVVTGYFQSLAGRDADTLSAFVDRLSDEDRASVENNRRIEAYSNINVQVYPGQDSDSYVVFAAYDYKYADFDAVLPGLTQLYISRMDDGKLRIISEPDESTGAYISQILEKEDVQTLISDTQAAYDAVLDSHADLKAYIEGLS